jgi:hypothetical protein
MSCFGAADGGQRSLLLVLELDPEAESDETERLGRQLRSDPNPRVVRGADLQGCFWSSRVLFGVRGRFDARV